MCYSYRYRSSVISCFTKHFMKQFIAEALRPWHRRRRAPHACTQPPPSAEAATEEAPSLSSQTPARLQLGTQSRGDASGRAEAGREAERARGTSEPESPQASATPSRSGALGKVPHSSGQLSSSRSPREFSRRSCSRSGLGLRAPEACRSSTPVTSATTRAGTLSTFTTVAATR